MKKTLSVILALIMVISAVSFMPFNAFAFDKSGKLGDNVNYNYELETNTLTISGSGDMYDFDYTGSPFYDTTSIVYVNIGSGVTSIGDYLFCNCSSVSSVDIPDTVTKVGEGAFHSTGIERTDLPASVQSIGDYAYWNCRQLSYVNIPYGITTIGARTFSDCSSITYFPIPSSVTTIGSYALAGCSNLRSLSLPSSVTTVENNAFGWCDKLETIFIYSNNITMGEDVFIYTPLESIEANCDNQYVADYIAKNPDIDWIEMHYQVERDAVPATCTSAGRSADIYCSKCGKLLESGEFIEAYDHSYKSKITATTSKTYTRTYTCTRCGKSYKKTFDKKNNTITVKAKKPTVKYASLRKKNQTIALKNWATVSKAQGKVTYKKSSGNSKITVNSKTGKITVKKGLKKGSYKIKIKVTAAGNSTYKSKTKTVTLTIKVK